MIGTLSYFLAKQNKTHKHVKCFNNVFENKWRFSTSSDKCELPIFTVKYHRTCINDKVLLNFASLFLITSKSVIQTKEDDANMLTRNQ